MYVNRDFFNTLKQGNFLEAVMLWGPRQVGKTTLIDHLPLKKQLFLDDLSTRTLAQSDPAALLEMVQLPCLIDEAQYAPNLFPELKYRIDRIRRENLKNKIKQRETLYYLTGSNRTLLDLQVQESLAGRANLFQLHGLSAKEIYQHDPSIIVQTLLFRGGFPLLYTDENIDVRAYLEDYILSFIEKDIIASAGVEKRFEFQTVLKMLAARSGQFLNVNELAGQAGVDSKTIRSWIGLLERNGILALVPPFVTNLTKRLVKMNKLFFIDTGLCSRIQGHQTPEMLWSSAQAGSLFESLVYSELLKTKINFLKDWDIFSFRTKAQYEIDFVLKSAGGKALLIEAKMGIHGAQAIKLDAEAKKIFTNDTKRIVVTVGGAQAPLGNNTIRVPVFELGSYLLREFEMS